VREFTPPGSVRGTQQLVSHTAKGVPRIIRLKIKRCRTRLQLVLGKTRYGRDPAFKCTGGSGEAFLRPVPPFAYFPTEETALPFAERFWQTSTKTR